MNSESTLILKPPNQYLVKKLYQDKSNAVKGFSFVCLWTIAAIVATAHTDLNLKITGVSLTFRLQDVLILILTTCMLAHGFTTANPYLVVPWIVATSWNVYCYQYSNLIKMVEVLQKARVVPKLAWVALGIDALALGTYYQNDPVFRFDRKTTILQSQKFF